MKKALFLSLACLLMTFSSCQKTEPGENGSTQKQEQVKEDTPESIILAVQDKYSYDSYAETSEGLTVFFHEPTPLTLIKEYPEGIKSVTILKEDFLSWTDNKSNLSIKFKDGKEAVLNKFCELDFTCDTATPISFDKFRETKTVNFSIVQNSEDALSVSVETSNNDFSVEVSVNSDKKGGSISITNNSSIEGETKITITAENGVGRKVKTIEAFYEDFHFVHKSEWCPWNEIDERIDGKTEVELTFDVELARKFQLTLNKCDEGVTTFVSEGARDWLKSEVDIDRRGGEIYYVNIFIYMTKNTGNQFRTGDVYVKSSKGKQLKVTVKQIGEQMEGSMRNALLALFNACGGESWNNHTNWNTDAEITEWHGINCFGCPNGSGQKQVDNLYDEWSLDLFGNNLSGTIPDDFWNIIDKFSIIDLSWNPGFDRQPLKEQIWHPNLFKLEMECCIAFEGPITPKIGKCKRLVYLDLMNNRLSGKIPDEIYDCTELNTLWLGNSFIVHTDDWDTCYGDKNRFDCTLSPKIKNLTRLETFKVSFTGIKGEIPDEIYEMDNLIEFSATYNFLTGKISENIAKVKKGRKIDIQTNCLSGSIPEYIGMTDLPIYAFAENFFTGTLPEGVRYMKSSCSDDYLRGASCQMKSGAPRQFEPDGSHSRAISEICYQLPMPDWAKERFGTTKWNQIDQKKSKYPYADDLQYPANEYYYDGKDWRHPKYEHPARFYHKVNGEWTYDPDWNWNHTSDPPINEVPEW